jgi:hypothetical protein
MYRQLHAHFAVATLAFLALPLIALGGQTGTEPAYHETTCYVLIEEGASAEGNALFLDKMGADSEALSRVAPTRFSVGAKNFLARSSGGFSYQADPPVLVERSGRLALYSVALQFGAEPLPAALKTVVVVFTLADLARTKDVVQPAAKAIELAAAKARMKSGMAWIVEIEMPSRGAFRATVALAK